MVNLFMQLERRVRGGVLLQWLFALLIHASGAGAKLCLSQGYKGGGAEGEVCDPRVCAQKWVHVYTPKNPFSFAQRPVQVWSPLVQVPSETMFISET